MTADKLKWRINRGVRQSNLSPDARLVMLVLSDMADAGTGVVPERQSPSTQQLAKETGLGESTVKARIAELEQLGWVERRAPTAAEQARHMPTRYRLFVGEPGGERVPKKRAPRKKKEIFEGPDFAETGGQEMTPAGGHRLIPAGGQEMTPESEFGGQEIADRGSGDSRPGVKPRPPYIKDDDLDDQDDLNAAANAAVREDSIALFEVTLSAPNPETEGQRVNRLARTYTDRVKLSSFHAVAGIVPLAIKAADDSGLPLYTDDQIAYGLEVLVKENRAVTANTLRIAIEGPPRASPNGGYQPWRDPDPSAYYDPKAKP